MTGKTPVLHWKKRLLPLLSQGQACFASPMTKHLLQGSDLSDPYFFYGFDESNSYLDRRACPRENGGRLSYDQRANQLTNILFSFFSLLYTKYYILFSICYTLSALRYFYNITPLQYPCQLIGTYSYFPGPFLFLCSILDTIYTILSFYLFTFL